VKAPSDGPKRLTWTVYSNDGGFLKVRATGAHHALRLAEQWYRARPHWPLPRLLTAAREGRPSASRQLTP